jgi:hypothetical protein
MSVKNAQIPRQNKSGTFLNFLTHLRPSRGTQFKKHCFIVTKIQTHRKSFYHFRGARAFQTQSIF